MTEWDCLGYLVTADPSRDLDHMRASLAQVSSTINARHVASDRITGSGAASVPLVRPVSTRWSAAAT